MNKKTKNKKIESNAVKNKKIESDAVEKWNKENTIDTPIFFRYINKSGDRSFLQTYPTSKAWTEDGYDIIMIECREEPVLLDTVEKDRTRLPRKIIKKYSRPINLNVNN